MKTQEREMTGFEAIYYKGQPVKASTVTSVETVLIARNKLHAWYLRLRYKKLGRRVVIEKWMAFKKIKELLKG